MMNKRGQLVITVIIAIVIVGILLVIFLFPNTNVFVQDVNPSSFLRTCVESDVKEVLDVITVQGGYIEPTNYLLYEGEKIQYLCYTAENYLPCVVQQPLLVRHVEQEIKEYVEPRARQCVIDLTEQYERQGFTVDAAPGEINVSIIPGSIIVDFIAPMTISKESTQTFQKFAVGLNSELYDLLAIATNIIEFETTYGDAETLFYIQSFPDLSIQKTKREGDTIYELRNVVSGDRFTFASRSIVWPQGYDLEP